MELIDTGFEKTLNFAHQLIKNPTIIKISKLDIPKDFILSVFSSSKPHTDSQPLSKTFSKIGNITLGQFFILQKIEKVKELFYIMNLISLRC